MSFFFFLLSSDPCAVMKHTNRMRRKNSACEVNSNTQERVFRCNTSVGLLIESQILCLFEIYWSLQVWTGTERACAPSALSERPLGLGLCPCFEKQSRLWRTALFFFFLQLKVNQHGLDGWIKLQSQSSQWNPGVPVFLSWTHRKSCVFYFFFGCVCACDQLTGTLFNWRLNGNLCMVSRISLW